MQVDAAKLSSSARGCRHPPGCPGKGRDYPQWEWSPLAVVLWGEDDSASSFCSGGKKGRGVGLPLGSICCWLFLKLYAASLLSRNNFIPGA